MPSVRPPPRRMDKKAKETLDAAKKGDRVAMFFMGNFYYLGQQGLSVDYPKAVEWWTLSANAGDIDAMCNLGVGYKVGNLGKDTMAFEWLDKAAKAGHIRAQMDLAVILSSGSCGAPLDLLKSFEWTTCAAKAGNADAMCNLGVIYGFGKGIPLDYNAAFTWFECAAKKGHARAQYYLGTYYSEGKGVEANFDKAWSWWQRSAKGGYKKAVDLLRTIHGWSKEVDHATAAGRALAAKESAAKAAAAALLAEEEEEAKRAAKPKVPKNEVFVPASVAFSSPAVDAAVGKVPKGAKRKADTLSPEVATVVVLDMMADRKAAKKAKAEAPSVGGGSAAPVYVPAPEYTWRNFYTPEEIERVCLCTASERMPSLADVRSLLEDLGFVNDESAGHDFWSKNKDHPSKALPRKDAVGVNESYGSQIKFSQAKKESGKYPKRKYGPVHTLLCLIDDDGEVLKCRMCGR